MNGLAARCFDFWLRAVVRARILVLFLALALTAIALNYAIANLGIDTDTTDMISPEAPFRQNDRAFRVEFPQFNDTLIVVVDGVTAEAVETEADALVRALQSSPRFLHAYRPDASPFLRRQALFYLSLDDLARLSDRLAQAEPLLGTLSADPTLRGLLQALGLALTHADDPAADIVMLAKVLDDIAAVATAQEEGRPASLSWRGLLLANDEKGPARSVIVARPKLDHATLSPAAAAMAEVRAEAVKLGISPARGFRVRLTGAAALEQEELKSAEIGGQSAAGLSLLLVTFLLAFGLRSLRLVLATVLTLAMGLIWTAAFAALAIGQLNLISVAFAVLFVGLAVDFSIHFCLRYREELQSSEARSDAELRAGQGVGRPLAISAVAAGIGFYSFLPTDYRGFAELGLISGTSMFIALFANFTVLPALLGVFRVRAAHALPRRDFWQLAEWLVSRHYRPVLALSVLALAGAVWLLPSLRFDFNPINLKDPGTESFMAFQDLAAAPGSAVYAANALTRDLASARALTAALSRLQSVDRAITLASFIPEGQDEKGEIIDEMALFLAPLLQARPRARLEDDERRRVFNDFRGELATLAGAPALNPQLAPHLVRLQAALADLHRGQVGATEGLSEFERRLLAHLPQLFGDLRTALSAGPVTIDDIPPELRRDWVGATGRYRVQAVPVGDLGNDDEMRQFVGQVLAAAPNATGTPVIVSEASDIVIAAFGEATLLALVAIALLLLILYRRPVFIALTLGPLILAAGLTLAVAVALGLALNFANVIVLPLLFGLGVSSSVHLVERQRHLPDPSQLMRTTTPRAVLFSTLTTMASFGSLAISPHRGMSSMGVLLTIAIIFTLICTLIVLPSLLPLLARWMGAARGRSRPS